MAYESLIENIEKLAKQKGVSKTTALVESEVGKDFTVNIEKKKTNPSIDKLQKLARYFGVSVGYLLGDENETAIDDNDIKFALFSGHDEITDEMFDEVRNFAKFVAEREREKKKNESK